MKRFKMLWKAGAVVLLGFLGLGLMPKTVLAAIPQLINLQGNLRDGLGNPVPDGSYSTTFRIYNAALGGTVLWSETQSVATDSGGFYVYLGSVNPIPDSVFNDASRWLGIQLSPDVEMTPRSRLVSVGSAYRVSSVEGASGGNIYGDINLHSTLTVGDYSGDVGLLHVTNGASNTITADGPSGDLTLSGGDIRLNNSTATSGNILKGGSRFIHNFGLDNTFIGRNAGNLTMNGIFNTASGAEALMSNTTGGNNAAGGYRALRNNTTGSQNTAGGAFALSSNTTGINNTANGASALSNNTTGVNNTASGGLALAANTTGNNNTASGNEALRFNTDGDSNTANGFGALRSNSSGDDNTAIGVDALRNNTTAGKNTAIGASALLSNTTGVLNTATGAGALANNTGGSGNTAIGYSALTGNATGNSNTAIGYGANVVIGTITNATAIGANALANASNKIRLGNSLVTVIEGQVGFTASSDKNQKENFQPVDGEEVLRKIRDFNLTSWNFIGHDPKQFRHYGPMAQDFFAAFGDDGVGKIGTETTLNTGDVAGILMAAVQALEKRKVEVADLKARIEYLEEKLKKIEAEKPQAKME